MYALSKSYWQGFSLIVGVVRATCLRTLCLFESPELIENVKLIHKPVSLQPRGLINKGNWCYINAVSFHSAFCCTCNLTQHRVCTCTCLAVGSITSSYIGAKLNGTKDKRCQVPGKPVRLKYCAYVKCRNVSLADACWGVSFSSAWKFLRKPAKCHFPFF